MKECIFCKIIAGESPSQMLYQDNLVTAFRDIHPVAPTHILIVPNKHIASINEISNQDESLVGHLFTVANENCRTRRDQKERLPTDHQQRFTWRSGDLSLAFTPDRGTADASPHGVMFSS